MYILSGISLGYMLVYFLVKGTYIDNSYKSKSFVKLAN